jgi:hypothetical protein
MSRRWPFLLAIVLALMYVAAPAAQTPSSGGTKDPPGSGTDLALVERLIAARGEYQRILEQLRAHYLNVGDLERARWAEDELRHYHRIPKQAFRLELDVPPPTLHASVNIPDANKMYTRAMSFKDKGYGTDYIDNQRRAELLFQQMITQFPQSNKISDAAYQLGDLYESKAYKQYRRAALYFERCYQWNPTTTHDARLRAARLYDRQLLDRGKAMEIYKEIKTHETDEKVLAEADKRLAALASPGAR